MPLEYSVFQGQVLQTFADKTEVADIEQVEILNNKRDQLIWELDQRHY